LTATVADFWCWDKLGALLLFIAIPIGLLQTCFLIALGIDSYEWFSSPLTSTSLMYLLLASWYFGMYPIRCIRRTLVPQVIERPDTTDEIVDAYLSFVVFRRIALLAWGLLTIVILQVFWMIFTPQIWVITISVGNVIIAWIILAVWLFIYLISTGIGGRLISSYLQKIANPKFEGIFEMEKKWMKTLRDRQSL
jgi:hypothetical protein